MLTKSTTKADEYVGQLWLNDLSKHLLLAVRYCMTTTDRWHCCRHFGLKTSESVAMGEYKDVYKSEDFSVQTLK